ncbi:MAG: GNAT family N-acetyltransferase [Pseudomonadota bacterium]|nr:GNAT family N-acetyltransferase [Pseudomonadota bacterium]
MPAISQIWPKDSSALDNPVWSALRGPHRNMAGCHRDVTWYPPSIAPFVAIASAEVVPDLESARGLGMSDSVYFVGACPDSLPTGWRIVGRSNILQLFPTGGIPESSEAAVTVLGETDRSAMRELTRIAFPDFFRERTAELGIYLGIYEGNKLIAMAGERLALTGLQEISGVCTHPDFTGRGYARRLTRALLARHSQRGVRSFLHVSEGNAGARRLYDSMGFAVRASLNLCQVERVASASCNAPAIASPAP